MADTQPTDSTLAEQLRDFENESLKKTPPEAQAIMRAAAERLARSDLAETCVKEGDPAPRFRLPGASGKIVALEDLLAAGPVVLSFYRGGWCPYCNLELRALQQTLPRFQELGASLLAISPEKSDHSLTTAEKNALDFEVLSDHDNQTAKEFGIVFELEKDHQELYKKSGLNLAEIHGADRFELPLPATYLIDRKGVIRYAFIHTDHHLRAQPAELVRALENLSKES